MGNHIAKFWQPAKDGKTHCNLCRFNCLIADGHSGRCGVRENIEGVLYTRVYGRVAAENIDPIEKKPLYHFQPGSRSFSLATVGCNLRCLNCQNAQISQWPHERDGIPGVEMSPAVVVQKAIAGDASSLSYTYTEPTIYYEYAYDTAVEAHKAGLKNIFVTNGYIATEALEELAPYLDAANVDLKGFEDQRYRALTGASLDGVLACLRDYRRLGIWLEVTTLVIPGHNDSADELRQMAGFIHDELGSDTPWHLSAFYPTYKMLDRPPTPLATLHMARDIGREAGLNYVYLGNVNEPGASDTICPGCGQTVINRQRLQFNGSELNGGLCRFCQYEIAGVGLTASYKP